MKRKRKTLLTLFYESLMIAFFLLVFLFVIFICSGCDFSDTCVTGFVEKAEYKIFSSNLNSEGTLVHFKGGGMLGIAGFPDKKYKLNQLVTICYSNNGFGKKVLKKNNLVNKPKWNGRIR
jgi:hypothetical protein